jgi:hypothetical protein
MSDFTMLVLVWGLGAVTGRMVQYVMDRSKA